MHTHATQREISECEISPSDTHTQRHKDTTVQSLCTQPNLRGWQEHHATYQSGQTSVATTPATANREIGATWNGFLHGWHKKGYFPVSIKIDVSEGKKAYVCKESDSIARSRLSESSVSQPSQVMGYCRPAGMLFIKRATRRSVSSPARTGHRQYL